MIRFSTWNNNDYLTVTDKTNKLIKVFMNMEETPFQYVNIDTEQVSGAVYAEERLLISLKGSREMFIFDKDNKLVHSLSERYSSVRIIKYLSGGSGHDYVLQVRDMDTDSTKTVIYNMEASREVAEVPMALRLKDIEYYENSSLFQFTECRVREGVYLDDDDEMIYRIIRWDAQTNGAHCNQDEDIRINWNGYAGVYISEDWDGYKEEELARDIHFPLFNYYCYNWPEDLSVSAYGKYFLQYSEDIEGIIIGSSVSGDAKYYFENPQGVDQNSTYYYNEEKNLLYVIKNDIRMIYHLSQDNQLLQSVNERYNQAAGQRKSLEYDKDFERLFYKCLYSAELKLLCSHSI